MQKYKEKYTKCTEHKRVHYAKCVKKQWSSQLKIALSVTFILVIVIPTHVHLSLNFPAKAHSAPSFSTPAFSTPFIWCRVFHPCHLVPRFPLPHFLPLSSGATFSTPAFSTLVIWCRVFHSRIFHPCHLVPCFPLPSFPPLLPGETFTTPAFSAPTAIFQLLDIQ